MILLGGGGNEIRVRTAFDGEARVDYNVGQLKIAREVAVEVVEEQGLFEYDFAIDEVRFSVNGRAAPAPVVPPVVQPVVQPVAPPPSLSADISGAPGSQQTLSISTDASAQVTVGLSTDPFITAGGRVLRSSFTGSRAVTIVLPNRVDTYTLTVTATTAAGTSQRSYTIRVVESDNGGQIGTEGRISITAVGAPVNGQQTIEVTVRNADGTAPSGAVNVTLSGAVSRTVETLRGAGRAIITLPNTATYTVTLSATGYTTRSVTLSTSGGTPTPPTPTPPTPPTPPAVTASEPDSIEITGPSTRSGTVNEALETALIVQVLDDDGDGVADARVIFRVISGRGKLSERGNGRAIGVQTDSRGYARADFTPLSEGTITVEAETTGVTRTVEFTITTGSAPPTETPGTGVTPRPVSPVVHVGAAKRPSMLWVDGGAIYALVGADVQEFAPSVDNAMNIAVGGGKVYWTEQTGESGGTINSVNLNGTGVTELASIFATPIGIAVDAAGSKLYWTNSAGRIQSANLNGSGITNVMQNLDNPMDLALAGGNVYWTQGTGSVRFVNLKGQKVVRNISTGLDTPGSLVIGGGKVYWTEKTGESGGTINSANLNGTGAMELASILAAPIGIAVDGSRSKLYWTNARGRIQSANLDGSKIQNVVDGLGSPGELVLGNSIAAPAATPTKTPKPTTTASKYDVNSDGTVDSKDVDALIIAVAAGVTDAKYDVNDDGKVDIFDVSAVSANRDAGAASAPTLLGMKLSAVEIDRLQEQIDLLIATNDRSPAAMRTLIYLQQLIVMARPEKTQLLANYPNPFNPETWIPYELATDTHVEITIYNTQGVVIRRLQLGQQSAGYYTGRDRAAYWDGRNALGEQVASGLYFYQFETDTMSSMRKMVILK